MLVHLFNELFQTDINDWDSIDSLDRLPSLKDLRILAIPLLKSLTDEERTHLVIGRLRNLRVLNGSTITPEQREQSERYFIRYYQVRHLFVLFAHMALRLCFRRACAEWPISITTKLDDFVRSTFQSS